MNIDLGMVRFSLPDEEAMAPVMFIAMGEKDEAPQLSVGPTMAKSTAQQFRKTLTMNLSALGEDEEVQKGLVRVAGELITRVRGNKGGSAEKNVGDAAGLLIEFTHEGHGKMPLRSVCWVGCKGRAIVTLNLTGLDQKKDGGAVLGKMMNGIIESVTL
jgi:hypothetical protein